MSEGEALQALLTTTGPLGSIQAVGFFWLSMKFRDLHTRIDALEKRIEKVEDK